MGLSSEEIKDPIELEERILDLKAKNGNLQRQVQMRQRRADGDLKSDECPDQSLEAQEKGELEKLRHRRAQLTQRRAELAKQRE